MDKPKYSLHLFAGAGGGIQADIIHGIKPVCAVEIEPYCQRLLAKRFTDLPVWDDVTTFSSSTPDCAEVFNDLRSVANDLVIAGGFPCQDISSAKHNAEGISGERSGLWKQYARIIGEIKPKWVFAENSALLVRRGLQTVLADLDGLGYDAEWCVLSAQAVGACHKRARIWVTARRRDCIPDDSVLGDVRG